MSYRSVIAAGLACALIGCWVDSQMTAVVGASTLALGQILRGLAFPCIGMPNMLMSVEGVPAGLIAQASGLYNVTRNLGGAVGISLVTWFIQMRGDHHYVRLTEVTTEGRLANTIFGDALAMARPLPAVLPEQTDQGLATLALVTSYARREALVLAYADTWLLISTTCLIGLCLIPFLPKSHRPQHAKAPAAH